jgi:N-acetylmuramoyl-L-alanine amidase
MAAPTPGPPGSVARTDHPVFRLGDAGIEVAELKDRFVALDLLDLAEVGDPGAYDDALERAVRAFQQQRGLTADGVVGRSTFRALEEARWRLGDRVLVHLPGRLQTGDDVLTLQRQLLDLGFKTGRVDGRFGAATEQAVREFQRNIGVPTDGTCGPSTLKALARLRPRATGGSPNALRSEERLRSAGPQLVGKVVVIDPAASLSPDPALRSLADEVSTDLARRVEGRLVATGVQAFLSVPSAGQAEEEGDRAAFANRTEAHLCISLLVDTSADPSTRGVSTYFFGIDAHGVRSSVGERFAGLVQREIVARTDLADLRTHARSWDLLRLTRMPTVCVEVGHAANAGDASRLADPRFRDTIAEAIVIAVQRLYLAPEADPHTGVLRIVDLPALHREDGESGPAD